jgi:serine/threonine-protein kinase HipA
MLPAAFFELYQGLPREGPGSDASTLRALQAVPNLPPRPRVLDLGCGPGKQTLVLARALQTTITASDTHQPFLDELTQRADAQGLSELVETRNISMDASDEPVASVDLVWSEGAAYCIGVTRALELWRPLVRPGGAVVFSEATWLTDNPPDEVRLFWQEAYPGIRTISGNVARAEGAGYRVTTTFPLPSKDWWTEYYTPLESRMQTLRDGGDVEPDLRAVIEESGKEIDMFRRFSDSYGYVFYVCVKAED